MKKVYNSAHSETKLVFFIDQINQAVSEFRNWNEEIRKWNSNPRQSKFKSKQQIDDKFGINNNFQNIINKIKSQTTQTFYNSSVSI